MKLRDVFSGEEYDVLNLDALDPKPNPEVPDEVLVELDSPAGETVTMSVLPGDDVQVLVDSSGYRFLRPLNTAEQFEIVED